jgi:hypothetical protein
MRTRASKVNAPSGPVTPLTGMVLPWNPSSEPPLVSPAVPNPGWAVAPRLAPEVGARLKLPVTPAAGGAGPGCASSKCQRCRVWASATYGTRVPVAAEAVVKLQVVVSRMPAKGLPALSSMAVASTWT